EQRSNDRTKDQVIQEVIRLWYENICSSMAQYLGSACKYFGANNSYPEKAIMDVLRLRVCYNNKFKEAIELLQHSIIPCQSPKCIILGPNDLISNKIEINPLFESYLVDSIGLFLKNERGKTMVDVFVDNIIMPNNISSIGNEFDATFITAIIQKRGLYVREELNRWKNGQQFDLPSWITPTMKFITTSNLSGGVPIAKYVNNMNYCSYAIQPDIYSGSDVVISFMDNMQNVVLLSASCTVSSSPIKRGKVKEQLIKSCMKFQYMECSRKRKNEVEFSYKKPKPKRLQIGLGNILPVITNKEDLDGEDSLGEEEEKYDQDLNYDDLDYDLDYTKNIRNYRISKVDEHAEYHEQIKTYSNNRKHIYISVEIPH
ncbi:17365_t:CDS:1, partial [Acaulospora morrowiae]